MKITANIQIGYIACTTMYRKRANYHIVIDKSGDTFNCQKCV